MKRRLARFKIAELFIRDALSMPTNARIIGIHPVGTMSGVYEFIVECPDFDEVETGDVIPEVRPVLKEFEGEKPVWNWGINESKTG